MTRAITILCALVLTAILAQTVLQIVREFHERPVQVFYCENADAPDCDEVRP